jgi:hypothetical protein
MMPMTRSFSEFLKMDWDRAPKGEASDITDKEAPLPIISKNDLLECILR